MSVFGMHVPFRVAITLIIAIVAAMIMIVSLQHTTSTSAARTEAQQIARQSVPAPPPAASNTAAHTARPASTHRRADVFAGTGAWIDIFDDWTQPRAFTAGLARRHVATLYVQTSNSSQPYAIYQPDRMGAMLEAAHDNGIRVVGWYLPELRSVALDLERSRQAMAFRSQRGDRFDGFALDIESQAVGNISTRVARLVKLSNRVRGALGPKVPLGAITPPPSKGTDNPRAGWPHFPWKQLAPVYDAWLPMSFFVLADSGPPRSRVANVRNTFVADVRHIRTQTHGAPQRPVHLVAETAAEAGTRELAGLAQAAKATKVTGASVYDAQTSTTAEWRTLRKLALPTTQPR